MYTLCVRKIIIINLIVLTLCNEKHTKIGIFINSLRTSNYSLQHFRGWLHGRRVIDLTGKRDRFVFAGFVNLLQAVVDA